MNPPQEITTHTLSKDSWQKIEETKHDHEHNKKMNKNTYLVMKNKMKNNRIKTK